MAPDLNSLPPSRSSNTSPNMSRAASNPGDSPAHMNVRAQSPSPSPRSASTSLQAAAAVNAGLQQEENTRRMFGFFICCSLYLAQTLHQYKTTANFKCRWFYKPASTSFDSFTLGQKTINRSKCFTNE